MLVARTLFHAFILTGIMNTLGLLVTRAAPLPGPLTLLGLISPGYYTVFSIGVACLLNRQRALALLAAGTIALCVAPQGPDALVTTLAIPLTLGLLAGTGIGTVLTQAIPQEPAPSGGRHVEQPSPRSLEPVPPTGPARGGAHRGAPGHDRDRPT